MPNKGYIKGNLIKCLPNRAEIVLTSGDIAVVDLGIVDQVRQHTWGRCDNRHKYAMTAKYREGKVIKTYLHHLIFPAHGGMHVDHINQNSLDNRQVNLRHVPPHKNFRNSKRPGVSLEKNNGKWRARITIAQGKTISLGCYIDRESAVKARQAGEFKYFGEIARRK